MAQIFVMTIQMMILSRVSKVIQKRLCFSLIGSERLREENAGDQIVISVARVLLTMTGQSKVKPM